ncbi:MAG: hypothetical protein M5U08_02895 [Burkholderiales bacterium]|nr:hypothetical protein [Burkholderiales bacterium]
MLRACQVEVGQAVVDEVDRALVAPQRAVAPREIGRVGDHGAHAARLEQPLEQKELRIQVLLGRRVVHDRDARRHGVAPRQAPFLDEHVEQPRLEAGGVDGSGEQGFDRPTARALRAPERGVEERPAGIGVDFDEAWPVGAEMEVVAQEHAARARIDACDRGCGGKRRGAKPGQRNGRLDRLDHRADPRDVLARDEHRQRRIQMRVRLGHGPGQPVRRQVILQPRVHQRQVGADAKALAVERVGGELGRGRVVSRVARSGCARVDGCAQALLRYRAVGASRADRCGRTFDA